MIVKMKFITLTGPKRDIDRVTNDYLSKYEIQLENALSELKTVDNLQPFTDTNPYKKPLEQADKAAELLSVPKTQDLPGLTSDQALRIISQTENICRSIEAQKEALELEEKNLTEQIKMIEPFLMAPMVHWPEVMVTYDTTDKILFSADAFGTFGAINGNLFADEIEFEHKWLDDARRYYTNIVGKYGAQVQALLKKASNVEIGMICPLHGPVWRKNIEWFVEKYQKWSTYEPEDQGVMIAYASIYGNTENAANVLASRLADKGLKNIAMYDVSVTHPSVVVSEAFRASHLVFASPTYNGGIFPNMETVLLDLKAHNLQKRTVAFMQNGTWAATSGRQMNEMVSGMKQMTVLEPTITIKSALNDSQSEEIDAMADAILESMN